MGYIKFVLTLRTAADDDENKPQQAIVKGFRTDMDVTQNYDLNLVMHALSQRGGRFTRGFILDRGRLDNSAWKLG